MSNWSKFSNFEQIEQFRLVTIGFTKPCFTCDTPLLDVVYLFKQSMHVNLIKIHISGAANALAFALLWVLYTSIVNVGQTFYGYGWESQLLETGFLAIWAFPLLTWRQMPKFCPPSWFTIVANRWLITRY